MFFNGADRGGQHRFTCREVVKLYEFVNLGTGGP